ncbi:hypothetical protein ACNFH5_30270 [Pseudomonas sp. NY15435]|uniref:hypothetical protein n=1 Tax=Pseudomonas sp. NY15435 TaxID=3400358 RepID=UPI003A8428E9
MTASNIIKVEPLTVGESITSSMPIPTAFRKILAVDPATVAQVVAAALKYLQARDIASWQDDVSDALDEISRKLDQVIVEIQRLRGYIDERITKESIDLFEGQINARRMTSEQILAGLDNQPMSSETKARLVGIMDELDVPLWQLMNWKKFTFDPYSAVIVGVLTKLLLLRISERAPGESLSFAKKANDGFFKPATDPSLSTSLEYARNATAAVAMQKSTELNACLNRWWLLSRSEIVRPGKGPDRVPEVTVYSLYGNATGSLENGFSISTSPDIGREVDWYPPALHHSDGYDAQLFKSNLEAQRVLITTMIEQETVLRNHVNNLIEVRDELERYSP